MTAMSMTHTAATAHTVIRVVIDQEDVPAALSASRDGAMCALFKNVANAANRMNQFRGETIIDLAPQTTDGHVDHVGVAVKMDIPYELRNLGPRQDDSLMPRHEGEQAEFFGGENELPAAAPGVVADQIQFQIRHAQRRRLLGGAAPQHATNAGQEFRERKGLEEIIIGAELKALDAGEPRRAPRER